MTVAGQDDAELYRQLVEAMQIMGFSQEEQDGMINYLVTIGSVLIIPTCLVTIDSIMIIPTCLVTIDSLLIIVNLLG